MIRSPLGLRINASPARSLRDQIRDAARIGAKGVVLDATGDLAPERFSETGRRELRHLLRSVELSLVAIGLPTRRPFDTEEGLEGRLARADAAFALTYELGARLVLARVGAVPGEAEGDAMRREVFLKALRELANRADHHGVRLAIETGPEAGSTLRAVLEAIGAPGLAASIDPAALLRMGHDPVQATRDLGPWVVHAYASDATGASGRTIVAHPRGFGFPAGSLDWAEYLGSLEEIDYRGFLTIWPDPTADQEGHFVALKERLNRL